MKASSLTRARRLAGRRAALRTAATSSSSDTAVLWHKYACKHHPLPMFANEIRLQDYAQLVSWKRRFFGQRWRWRWRGCRSLGIACRHSFRASGALGVGSSMCFVRRSVGWRGRWSRRHVAVTGRLRAAAGSNGTMYDFTARQMLS